MTTRKRSSAKKGGHSPRRGVTIPKHENVLTLEDILLRSATRPPAALQSITQPEIPRSVRKGALPEGIHIPKHWQDPEGGLDLTTLGASLTPYEVKTHKKHWRGTYRLGETRADVLLHEKQCLAYNCWMVRDKTGAPRYVSEQP
jgi:hypothetical protein